MSVQLAGFVEELAKLANLSEVVEKAIGAPDSPLRKAIGRAALLGAGTSAVEAALEPREPGQKRHLARKAAGGAAAGAVAGRAFPGWFGRSSTTPES